MSITQQIVEVLGPFLPIFARVRDRAADEAGRSLPAHIAGAFHILARRHDIKINDPASLKAQLEDDSELRQHLAATLGIHEQHTNRINFHDRVDIGGDFVAGDKHDH